MSSVSLIRDNMRLRSKSDRKIFTELDRALVEADNRQLTSCNKSELHTTRVRLEQIITKIVAAMRRQSDTFSKMFYRIRGVGSAYERTKIGRADEFDIDVVLRIPDVLNPVLRHGDFPGFARMELTNFEILSELDPEMYRSLKHFVDDERFLLSEELILFFSRIFTGTIAACFPGGVITVGSKHYKISKAEYIEPALTLTIEGEDFLVSVDLVASFQLDRNFWPNRNYRRNPCPLHNEFFLTPARPIGDYPHKNRLWRLSFHSQERQIVFKRYWMKPAFRVLKRIRDHLKQTVHSYAIKTLFLWELCREDETPVVFRYSLSYAVIYMLEKYAECLTDGFVPHFWDHRLNLLSYLSDSQMEQYRRQVIAVLDDIKRNPHPEVLLKYLN